MNLPTCDHCGGSGEVAGGRCAACHGAGVLDLEKLNYLVHTWMPSKGKVKYTELHWHKRMAWLTQQLEKLNDQHSSNGTK